MSEAENSIDTSGVKEEGCSSVVEPPQLQEVAVKNEVHTAPEEIKQQSSQQQQQESVNNEGKEKVNNEGKTTPQVIKQENKDEPAANAASSSDSKGQHDREDRKEEETSFAAAAAAAAAAAGNECASSKDLASSDEAAPKDDSKVKKENNNSDDDEKERNPSLVVESASSYKGRRIAKWFSDQLYFGTIDDIANGEDGQTLYHVTYDDGDEEDLYLSELNTLLELYLQHQSATETVDETTKRKGKGDEKTQQSETSTAKTVDTKGGDDGDESNNSSYKGKRVAKLFGGELYFGTIHSIDQDDQQDGETLYHVTYDDGDEEDIYLAELTKLLKLYEQQQLKDFVVEDDDDSALEGEIPDDDDDDDDDFFVAEGDEKDSKDEAKSRENQAGKRVARNRQKVVKKTKAADGDNDTHAGNDDNDDRPAHRPQIGQRVAQRFNKGLFFGIIDNVFKDEDGGPPLYQVTFDDKDGQDFEVSELQPLFRLYEQQKQKDPFLLLKKKRKEGNRNNRGPKHGTSSATLVRCDLCQQYEEYRGDPDMLQCSNCQVAVHKNCYGIQTYDFFEWKCWPCFSLNKRIPASDLRGKGVGDLIQEAPPTRCDLCEFSSFSEENNKRSVHAFHPIYDNYGPNARQLAVPYKDDTDGTTKHRLVWGHSLCGFMLSGFLFGCTAEGQTHEGVYHDRFDDRPPNPYLRDVQEDEIDLNVNGKYGSKIAPMHHFVFPTKLDGITLSTTTKERITRIEQAQSKYSCFICRPSKQQQKEADDDDSNASIWGDGDDEEKEFDWKDEDGNHKAKDDFNGDQTTTAADSDLGSLRIALPCSAGDVDEYTEFDRTHNLKNEEPCFVSMHVGCARWGMYSFEDPTMKFVKRVKFLPGLPEVKSKELRNPIRCIYCNHHATNVTPSNVEKMREIWMRKQERKKEAKKRKRQREQENKRKSQSKNNAARAKKTKIDAPKEPNLKEELTPKQFKQLSEEQKIINMKLDVIKHLQGLGNRITDTDSVRKVFRERKDHFQNYKVDKFKDLWKVVKENIAGWLNRQIEKISKK